MAASKDSLIDLERRRAQLEKTVADLRKSLQHWQIWEAEYEGLKEEILALGADPPRKELVGTLFQSFLTIQESDLPRTRLVKTLVAFY